MSLDVLINAPVHETTGAVELDAEAWVASLTVETNLAKIAGECIAVGNFNIWQAKQRCQREQAEPVA